MNSQELQKHIRDLLEPFKRMLVVGGSVHYRADHRNYVVRVHVQEDDRAIHKSIGIGPSEEAAECARQVIDEWRRASGGLSRSQLKVLEECMAEIKRARLSRSQKQKLRGLVRDELLAGDIRGAQECLSRGLRERHRPHGRLPSAGLW